MSKKTCLLVKVGLLVKHFVHGVIALELRHDFLHLLYGRHIVVMLAYLDEVFDVALHGVVVVLAHLGDADFVVEGRHSGLLLVEHLLIELLSGTQTSVLNLYTRGSTQLYHALRKVGNLDGVAHVEDKYLAAVALRASLKHQLARFGDEHKEANDVGIGDRYGAASLYLTLEERDDRTVGAEHIAEAGGDKLRDAFYLARLDGMVEALYVNLADAL